MNMPVMPQIGEAQPPYVEFEVGAVEDRKASLEQGKYISKDVNYVYITPAGSKDRIPRIAEEWLEQLKQQAREGRFPAQWYNAYQQAYDNWKNDLPPPVTGTPIEYFTLASPAQIKAMKAWRVRTIEDLAHANDEAVMRIGMGARTLKNQAIEWLKQAEGRGASVAEVESLRTRVKQLEEENAGMATTIRELRQRLGDDSVAGSGTSKADLLVAQKRESGDLPAVEAPTPLNLPLVPEPEGRKGFQPAPLSMKL